jgi:hypothetical protein
MTEPTEVDMEAPEADAAEQRTEVSPAEPPDERQPDLPFDADPADVSEQGREVGYDDDEYR